MKIGPVVQKIMRVTTNFLNDTEKMGTLHKYLRKYWPIFTKFSTLIDIYVEII